MTTKNNQEPKFGLIGMWLWKWSLVFFQIYHEILRKELCEQGHLIIIGIVTLDILSEGRQG